MIAFFDTNIHIPLLSGALSSEIPITACGNVPVGLSPVVASELLRGVSGRGQRKVEQLVRQLVPVQPLPGSVVGMRREDSSLKFFLTMKPLASRDSKMTAS